VQGVRALQRQDSTSAALRRLPDASKHLRSLQLLAAGAQDRSACIYAAFRGSSRNQGGSWRDPGERKM